MKRGIEYQKEILDEVESNYIRQIIRPFKDKIDWIAKIYDLEGCEHLAIAFIHDEGYMLFPGFPKGTMYAGMELEKQYKLKELNL